METRKYGETETKRVFDNLRMSKLAVCKKMPLFCFEQENASKNFSKKPNESKIKKSRSRDEK